MKIISIILCILVTLTSCSLINTNSTSQSEIINQTQNILPKEIQEYVEKNLVTASDKNIIDMFKTIDTEKYDIIFTGEAHGISNNYKIKTELIKYLTKNWNLKYILTEVGFAASQYLNLYFETGNELYLDNFVKDSVGFATYSHEEYNYYKDIYEYNKTLSDERKLKIIGIDTEKNLKTAFRYMDYCFKNSEKTDTIKLISKFANNDEYTNTNLWEEHIEDIKNIISDFNNNKNKYKIILNEKFYEYAFIIDNISAMIKFYEDLETTESLYFTLMIKEEKMSENFKEIYQYIKNSKIYGDFSSMNVMKQDYSTYLMNNGFLANLINEKFIDKEKVCSIDFYYENSKILLNNKIYDTTYTRNTYETFFIDNYLKSNYAIITVNADNSPFNDKYYDNFFYYGTDTASKFINHIIFVKDSPMSHIYSDVINYTNKEIISTEYEKMDRYLLENMKEVSEKNISSIFNLINIEQYDIICKGEVHGIESNYIVDFEIIKYLAENYGFKYILIENSFVDAQYINLYLKTGDESFLDRYLLSYEYQISKKSFYKKIYEYNKTLSEENKLIFIGNDIDLSINTTINYLNYLISNTNQSIPSEIKDTIFKIKRYITTNSYKDMDFWRNHSDFIKNIIDNFCINIDLYKIFLDERFNEYRYVIESIERSYQLYVKDDYINAGYDRSKRENALYKNFIEIYKNLKDSKIYVIYGEQHTVKMQGYPYVSPYSSFVSRLIKNKYIDSSKIYSIYSVYDNCISSYDRKTYELNNENMENRQLQYASQKMVESYALVKANPNNINLFFGTVYRPESDFYDYALIIKNSKAAH